jgi:hypothetical protein
MAFINWFHLFVSNIFMNKTRPHLLYFLEIIFFIFISFLIQLIKHKLNTAYTNREIEPNNKSYTYSAGMYPTWLCSYILHE